MSGELGVRFTDDATIHEINVRHLSHDYPTDVISFPYSDQPPRLEGELVASVDTALENAVEAGWAAGNELLLYVIHGVLHIAGMDDATPSQRREMRVAEQAVLNQLGIGGNSTTDRSRHGGLAR
ncbi:rRNA maturation RNase YbeY [Roseiconus nitratireducens]|uniref:Endoribonuclease YbeY n=2 Tax=Roseiconus nitratireducens TaxID=2605748 RepID=A0A5M6D6U6_9BACT|nr:rRNA maturation RNase YbeY [Roseiconus nitratireducens]